jgi:phosphoglycerate-specific signal transduction histidine kinase
MRARERGIELILPEADCQVPAIGEFRRVLQVLLNLLSNAIRYTPEKTIVRLDCGLDGGAAWIAVEDSGQGLTDLKQPASSKSSSDWAARATAVAALASISRAVWPAPWPETSP